MKQERRNRGGGGGGGWQYGLVGGSLTVYPRPSSLDKKVDPDFSMHLRPRVIFNIYFSLQTCFSPHQ